MNDMKKLFTTAFAAIVALGASAQVTFDRDTAYVKLVPGVEEKGNILVTNTTNRDVEVEWKTIETDLDMSWKLAFCDFYNCYFNDFGSLPSESNCDAPICYLSNGYSANWYLQADPQDAPGSSRIFRIEVTTGSTEKDTLTWITQDFTGVSTLEASVEEYFAYPIPAINELNIRFVATELSGATLVLYDLSGKEMKRKNLQGELSTLNVGEMTSGVYILSILDDNNKVLVTQKWTKM